MVKTGEFAHITRVFVCISCWAKTIIVNPPLYFSHRLAAERAWLGGGHRTSFATAASRAITHLLITSHLRGVWERGKASGGQVERARYLFIDCIPTRSADDDGDLGQNDTASAVDILRMSSYFISRDVLR